MFKRPAGTRRRVVFGFGLAAIAAAVGICLQFTDGVYSDTKQRPSPDEVLGFLKSVKPSKFSTKPTSTYSRTIRISQRACCWREIRTIPMKIKPTQEEIDRVLDRAAEATDNAESQWPGMIYEQGVHAAIMWVLGNSKDNPMEN